MGHAGHMPDALAGRLGPDIARLAHMPQIELLKEIAHWTMPIGPDGEPQIRPVPHADAEVVRSAFSGGMVGDIFTKYFGTSVRDAYAEAPSKIKGWVWVSPDLENYRETRLLRVQDDLALLPRNRAPLTLAPLTAFGYAWRAYEFARALTVQEVDFIDDTFGVILRIARGFGKAARRCQHDLVFALLLSNPELPDGQALYSEAHGNYLSGGDSALSNTSLATAIQMIRSQVLIPADGAAVVHPELTPRYLVVPPALENTARQIMRLQMLDDDSDLQLIVSSRLGPNGCVDPITGTLYPGSNTNWMLTCDAETAPTIALGFLEGSREPQIEAFTLNGANNPEGEWGMRWALHQSMAVAAIDYRGSVWSAGA
jgi:hypothetical protein